MRGAWIGIYIDMKCARPMPVAPHAGSVDWNPLVRGAPNRYVMSLPMRGAWIEIWISTMQPEIAFGRSPCGERGLKFVGEFTSANAETSLPMRGAWIETHSSSVAAKPTALLPLRGAWIKIRGSCQATITGNVSGWQMVHLWCYSLSDCDWRKVCGSIFKKTR